MISPAPVIFDLDGTLIDSAAAILASFRAAFAACGVAPVREIVADIIGPPLRETLARLAGSTDPALLDVLSDAFRKSYDSGGLLESAAYPDVGELLAALRTAGHGLYLATNKRIHPTRLILDHLGWSGYFGAVYTLDLFTPGLPNKAATIGRLLADCGIDPANAVYVGDREEDGQAAEANGLAFIAAVWGYGGQHVDMPARWRRAATPQELGRMLLDAR